MHLDLGRRRTFHPPLYGKQRGRGPAWENSLFEDGAEFGYGMNLAVHTRQEAAADLARSIAQDEATPRG